MAEVVLFNHIPKTAGSTMRRVLFRTVGGKRVLFATTLGEHREQLGQIVQRLDGRTRGSYAVIAHTGWGIQDRLPARHEYRAFTMLREPVDRTISMYFYSLDSHRLSLEQFLEQLPEHSYNHQTAFLGGLTAPHHLDGEPIRREQFDRALLERAKRNLESHLVVGLTERFDDSLVLLRRAYGWPRWRMRYKPVNVGNRKQVSPAELEAVRAYNELDIELYELGREVFEDAARRG
jgi:hypothetical protein